MGPSTAAVVAPLLILKEPLHPLVQELKEWLKENGNLESLDQAVNQALGEDVAQMRAWGIISGATFLQFASASLNWIPTEELHSRHIYWMLVLFYFIFNQPALADLQTPILPTQIGISLPPLSNWIVRYSREFGNYMELPESLTPESYDMFKRHPKYNLWEAELPQEGARNDGFRCFNDFFARRLKAGKRPVAEPEDDTVITHAADTVFDERWTIDENNLVNCKGLYWSISNLLDGSVYADHFKGGTWVRGFLDSTDYHHVHAPVGGKVVEAQVIQGICGLDIIITDDVQGNRTLMPHRVYKPDPATGEGEVAQATDNVGYVFLSMRGLFIIENAVLGYVAVLPIGMAHCSSVIPVAKRDDILKKGDELSEFRFGGSDLVMIFEKKANVRFGPMGFHHVGEELGRAFPFRT